MAAVTQVKDSAPVWWCLLFTLFCTAYNLSAKCFYGLLHRAFSDTSPLIKSVVSSEKFIFKSIEFVFRKCFPYGVRKRLLIEEDRQQPKYAIEQKGKSANFPFPLGR